MHGENMRVSVSKTSQVVKLRLVLWYVRLTRGSWVVAGASTIMFGCVAGVSGAPAAAGQVALTAH